MIRKITCVLGGALILTTGAATSAMAEASAPFRILISNDDGVSSEGIAALVSALRPFADITVAAPATDSSGASQSVTLIDNAVRVENRTNTSGVPHYAVFGTPADSVIFGLLGLGRDKPFDLVISGINKGENVGDAIPVSGTLGAARQAVMMGVPALAVSQQFTHDGKYDFSIAARYTAKLARTLHAMGSHAPRFVSINVPSVAKGVRVVSAAGSAFALAGLTKVGEDRANVAFYRATIGKGPTAPATSDTATLAAGYIALTILTTDANADPLPDDVAQKFLSIAAD